MANLSPEQENKIARLLIHFTNRTNSEILGRFDRATRNRIRESMKALDGNEPVASADSLKDFAEFLYFEPDTKQPSPSRQEIKPAAVPSFEFTDIVRFDDDRLDKLLQAAPVELTLDALSCSPTSFVDRVIRRLSVEDADLVRQRLASKPTIDYSQMKSIHRQFCEVAENLTEQGSPNDQGRN